MLIIVGVPLGDGIPKSGDGGQYGSGIVAGNDEGEKRKRARRTIVVRQYDGDDSDASLTFTSDEPAVVPVAPCMSIGALCE
ncbi:hypothetical protein [Burkholderia cenocepacia]|uniref:hypothetical protein n=1 Tax=Burkholderia cenocepacia TaxID=95486 RepID=UPI0009822228|nr:hypothetical protein [Burkholderia cenocepacia]AQQ31583.1 hypothetical protein A8E96_04000 [Burkholderia cenocepacia]MBR8079766.1 hypothetical protein [Burkholderia cenocepacia]